MFSWKYHKTFASRGYTLDDQSPGKMWDSIDNILLWTEDQNNVRLFLVGSYYFLTQGVVVDNSQLGCCFLPPPLPKSVYSLVAILSR